MKTNDSNQNRVRAELFATMAIIPVLAAFMVVISMSKPAADTNVQNFPSSPKSYYQPITFRNYKSAQINSALQNSYVENNLPLNDEDTRIIHIFESAIAESALIQAKNTNAQASDLVISFSDSEGTPVRARDIKPKVSSGIIFADNIARSDEELIKKSYPEIVKSIGGSSEKRPIRIKSDSTLPPQINALYIEPINEIRFHTSVLEQADAENRKGIILHSLVHAARGKYGLSQPIAWEEQLAENVANKIIRGAE